MLDKEIQQRERVKAQDMAEQLSKENKHLLLKWATGVGKGKAVMQCIAASLSTKPWLIIVPEILQIENYKLDLEKHGYGWMLGSKIIDIICYASVPAWEGRNVNLALNEVHRLTKLKSSIIRKGIHFDQIISDGATIPVHMEAKLYDICPYYEYEITLSEAIERGILPSPSIYVIPIKLDNKHLVNIVKTKKFTRKYTDYGLSKYYDGQYKYWEQRHEEEDYPEWIKTKLLQIGTIRKKFLAGKKTAIAKTILDSLKSKKYICFTGSIEQCDELGGHNAIHSKKGKAHNLLILSQFNKGEQSSIFVNNMGREGLNLEGIEAGVIVQLDSGGRDAGLSFIQKTGRSMRADDPEIYIIYAEDTQDELYLRRALQHIDKQYIKKLQTI